MKTLYPFRAALLLLFVILFIAGCGENEDCTECCDTVSLLVERQPAKDTSAAYPYHQFNGTLSTLDDFYYYYLPGTPARVQFFIGKTNTAICTNEHLTIYYGITTTAATPDRPIKIFGEIYWSIFSDEIILVNGMLTPNLDYTGSIGDVGLKQAFPEGAAEADVYINVEFESLGSFDLDKAYFQQHIYYMEAKYDYKKF